MLSGDLEEVFGQSPLYSGTECDIDGRVAARLDGTVDDSRHCECFDACGSERNSETGGNEAQSGWPLRRILHDIGPETRLFAAADGSVIGERTDPAREENERLFAKIGDSE